MQKVLPVRFLLLTAVFGLFVFLRAQGQMKIGANPTQINKSSILELESDRQGLLLTRINDFTGINNLIGSNHVDGMIVYYTGTEKEGAGLYMRKDDDWVKIASATEANNNWSLSGNAGTDGQTDFVGTTDAQDLILKANNTEGLRIDNSSGDVKMAKNVEIAGDAKVDGNLKINAASGTNELSVLVIQADGTIVQRELPGDIFSSVVTSITDGTNSLGGNVPLYADADANHNDFNVEISGGQVNINAPVMDGTNANATYGFMTKEDWDKLNNMAGINQLTIGNLILIAADDAEKDKAAKISDDGSGNYEIRLIEADATHNGVVTINNQTFAGEKTFVDNTTVGNGTDDANFIVAKGTATLNGETTVGNETAPNNLIVHGGMAARTININSSETLSGNKAKARTILIDASGGDVNITLPTSAPDLIDGRIYTFRVINNTTGMNKITISGAFGDGHTDMVFYNKGSSRTIQYTGSKWYVIGQ